MLPAHAELCQSFFTLSLSLSGTAGANWACPQRFQRATGWHHCRTPHITGQTHPLVGELPTALGSSPLLTLTDAPARTEPTRLYMCKHDTRSNGFPFITRYIVEAKNTRAVQTQHRAPPPHAHDTFLWLFWDNRHSFLSPSSCFWGKSRKGTKKITIFVIQI